MRARQGFTIFETAIGWCGLAWGEKGLIGAQLPEEDADRTRARLQRRLPDAEEAAAPQAVQTAMAGVSALVSGEPRDLTFVDLDLEGLEPFNHRVYAIARAIPPGRTRTYGDIATDLGDRLAARDVGRALGENPFPIIVPCHWVLAAGGRIGGFSANGGVTTKVRLLAIENAQTGAEPSLFGDEPTFSLAPIRPLK